MVKKIIILFFLIIVNYACSSSYDDLIKNNYTGKDEFSINLLKEYKKKAIFEASEMHDWNSAKLYSEKALLAAKGIKIKPQKINFWKIPKNNILELRKAHENLSSIYDSAFKSNPKELAIAISSLDCWFEQQEEGWQLKHIEECKNNYLKAMHLIYDNLNKIETKKEITKADSKKNDLKNSAVVLTKNKEDEIFQIIYFDFDVFNLNAVNNLEIKNFLDQYSKKIKKYIIVGHTDTKGTKKYNLDLSIKRAEAVKKYLINNGIDEKNVKVIGKGEETLLIQTDDEIAHPANRRAEISTIN